MLPFTEHGDLRHTDEPILLFLHYFGGSQREWARVVAHLTPAHRCATADMPGFGDAADLNGYTVEQMRDHVAELVLSFAPAPVTLIGHSMSGKVGMVLAGGVSALPPNLRQLILVAPSPLQPEPMTEAARATMTEANASLETATKFAQNGAHHPLSADDLRTATEDVLRANPEAWRAWPQSGTREDWSTRITALRVPTQLIVGDHDQAIPLAFQQEHTLPLVQATGGKLTVIQNAGHLLPYEAAEDLSRAFRKTIG